MLSSLCHSFSALINVEIFERYMNLLGCSSLAGFPNPGTDPRNHSCVLAWCKNRSSAELDKETVTRSGCWSAFVCFPKERQDKKAKNWVNSSDCIWHNGAQVGAGHRPQVSQGPGETAAQELPKCGRQGCGMHWCTLKNVARGIPQTHTKHT